ncbi:MAG: rod shape-determining protein MreC, partial [Planctomycetes bacterium]|nr:rod shape-determining protein MreC [Planctomycetota bacterium]
EDTRRRLGQLSKAQEFIPELKTLHFVTASVVLHAGQWPGASGGGSFVLDRGSADGVVVGSALLQGQAVLGQVVEVSPHASRGIMLNHPNLIIAGRLGGQRTECYIRGSVAGVCEAVFLGRQPEAKEGDLIFTSGLLGYFPKNLTVGELAETPVEDGDQRTYVARLRPTAELDAVEGVIIVNSETPAAFPEPRSEGEAKAND